MPSIAQFLINQGWGGGGAEYFYPSGQGIPHLHLKVANAQTIINDYPDIAGNIVYFGLTNLKQPHPNIRLTDAPEDVITDALRNNWAGDELQNVQVIINQITGRGIAT